MNHNKLLFAFIFLLACALGAQAQNPSAARRLNYGTALPATCDPTSGEVFIKVKIGVAPAVQYFCSDTNTWTELDAGGGKQPLDSDLTTIAGLTATTDNFMQSKAGAWASRTVAQVKTDLGLSGTNSGDQTSIVGITGTTAQFNTALTDNDFATLAGTETLTGKTINADSNTLTNIENADIKAAAAIDATKVAGGTVDNTEFGYLNGITSAVQTQLTARPTGSGTTGKLSKWTGTTALGDSIVQESGTSIGVGVAPNVAYSLTLPSHLLMGTTRQMSLIVDYAGFSEIPAGAFFGSIGNNGYTFGAGTNSVSANTGAKVVGIYSNGTTFLSAIEWANVASGNTTVSLVKSGGAVEVGGTLKLGANGTAESLSRSGTCTLVAGSCTVSDSNVTTSSKIFLTGQDNTTTGALRISARTASTSFTVTSSNAADTGVVAWRMIN